MPARIDVRLLSAIALLIVTGAVSWQVWSTEVDISAVPPSPDMADSVPQEPNRRHTDVQLPPLESFAETRARPLFSPSRRPVERIIASVPTHADVAPATEGLRLLGVLRREGTSRALVATSSNPSGAWVGVGHEFGSWRLAEINDDAITLSSGRHAQVLALYQPAAARKNEP